MANLESVIRQMSNENTARTFAFNANEAEKARGFQEYMSNTSHQREVEDLKRAGINPVLSANGGAQAYSASSASGSADSSAVGAIASIYMQQLSNENAMKIAKMNNDVALANKRTDKEIAHINAAASKYASDQAYSASRYSSDNSFLASKYSSDNAYSASKYASDNAYSASKYNTDKSYKSSYYRTKKSYDTSDAGMIDSLGLGKTGTKIAKGSYVGARAFGNILGSILNFKKKPTSITYKR